MPERKCDICGTEYRYDKSREGKTKYCSYACLGRSKVLFFSGENARGFQREAARVKACSHCGVEYRQRQTEGIGSFTERKFCSKKCADVGGFRYLGADHPNYKETTIRNRGRGRHVERWGNAVKLRDGYMCRRCGNADLELHAHHIKPWVEFPDLRYDVGNGITLCASCHWHVHTAQNENAVNSVDPLTDNAEGNTEPSFGRKPVEGVTTRGRAYRRWFGQCAQCKTPISKRFSDTKGKDNMFCSKKCASTFNFAAGKIGRNRHLRQ